MKRTHLNTSLRCALLTTAAVLALGFWPAGWAVAQTAGDAAMPAHAADSADGPTPEGGAADAVPQMGPGRMDDAMPGYGLHDMGKPSGMPVYAEHHGAMPGMNWGPATGGRATETRAGLGLMGPGMLDSLPGPAGGLSAAELLGPEILPHFKQLTKEKQDRLRQLHVSMMQVLVQQRAALQAQMLGLRETLHGYPVDAEAAARHFQGMQDARNAMFQILLNGLAQQQRLLGPVDWQRLHGLEGADTPMQAAPEESNGAEKSNP